MRRVRARRLLCSLRLVLTFVRPGLAAQRNCAGNRTARMTPSAYAHGVNSPGGTPSVRVRHLALKSIQHVPCDQLVVVALAEHQHQFHVGEIIKSFSPVEPQLVLLDDVTIGEGALVRNAVLDKNAVVPPGARIGHDRAQDAQRYTVSERGVVTLAKGARAVLED